MRVHAIAVTVTGRPGRSLARPRPVTTAAELWAQGRRAADVGRPAAGLRLGTRALRRLNSQGPPAPHTSALRARILILMADTEVERGQIDHAAALLDEAVSVSPACLPVTQASRGVLYARTGRLDLAWQQFDAAVTALSVQARPGHNLVRALLWRGLLHLSEARTDLAEADCRRAQALGRDLGMDAAVAIGTHTLGLVYWLSGDLPGALQEMASADAVAPGVRAGIRSLDRARVLLAAGLLAEAKEFAERAERVFVGERARADLADSLLVRAEIDIIAGDTAAARFAARRAARSFAGVHHERGVLAARVMAARAEAEVRAAMRPLPRARARRDAAEADKLAADLVSSGLLDDARTVRLLQSQALLHAGDVLGAQEAATVASELAAPGWQSRRRRVPLIGTELHTAVVAARLDLAQGRRAAGLAQIRRGLDDLAVYQASFGSQDLQSASAVHGRELTRLGLRTALQTRSPAAILQWLERSRAASTRLPAVRPSADGELAAELSRLRMASYRARTALLAGSADPDLDGEIDTLRRRVRFRSWVVGGSGAVSRPLPLAEVQRRLADAGQHASVVAPFRGFGRFHALVITGQSARYLELDYDFGLEALLHKIIGDLNVLADHRIMAPLRRVARESLRLGLDRVAATIVRPLEAIVDDGPVIVAAAGSAAIVPWALLPGLAGRAVSVSPSVTSAVADLGGHRAKDHRSGVLAVAGPEVAHGAEEAYAVAAVYDNPLPAAPLPAASFPAAPVAAGIDRARQGKMPSTVLTGPAATGGAVLEAIPAGGLVHIAAHGHHEPDNPLFSGVLLADGLLYGYDVAPNPALPGQVVLSSCDVGRTDDRPGGEPLGLVAALLRSGVSTVIAGTSRVSDEIAATVMTAYHQRLRTGDGPAVALAGAIHTVAGPGEDPAPFTCFGAGH